MTKTIAEREHMWDTAVDGQFRGDVSPCVDLVRERAKAVFGRMATVQVNAHGALRWSFDVFVRGKCVAQFLG